MGCAEKIVTTENTESTEKEGGVWDVGRRTWDVGCAEKIVTTENTESTEKEGKEKRRDNYEIL